MQSLKVLVTRPAHQNENLTRELHKLGHEAINLPTIAIEPAPPSSYLQQLKDHVVDFDIALFVSRNAVDHAFHYLSPQNLPDKLQLGVIGKGSLLAMQALGIDSQIIPAQSYNSEGLLETAALKQVSGKNIIIFRGQQGRNLLGDTLQQRGAKVTFCEVYRRCLPYYTPAQLNALLGDTWPDLVIFTSAEGLQNCFQLVTQEQGNKLKETSWLLISERMRETARNLRHNADILIAKHASDEGILQAIKEWQQNKD